MNQPLKKIFFFKKTLKEFWEKIEIKDPTEEEIDRTTFWNKLERLDSLLSLFCINHHHRPDHHQAFCLILSLLVMRLFQGLRQEVGRSPVAGMNNPYHHQHHHHPQQQNDLILEIMLN